MSWFNQLAAKSGVEIDNTPAQDISNDDNAWKYISAGDISGLADYTNRNYNYRTIPFLGQIVGHAADAATQGVADVAQFVGAQGVGDYLNEKAQKGEEELPAMSTPELSLAYLTDPNGLASAFGMMGGSMLSMAPVAALAPEFLPARAAAALSRVSKALSAVPKIGGALEEMAPMAGRFALTGPVEAMMEGGNTEREMLQNGATPEEARQAAWDVFGENVGLLTATNALEGGLLGKIKIKTPRFSNPVANTVSRVAGYVPTTAAEMALQGYEEGAQQGIQNGVEGESPNTFGQILNPTTWTDDQWDAAKMGIAGAVPLMGAMGAVRHFGNRGGSGNSENGSNTAANSLLSQAQTDINSANAQAAQQAAAQAQQDNASQETYTAPADDTTTSFDDSQSYAPSYDASVLEGDPQYTISGEVSSTDITPLTDQKMRLLDAAYYNKYGQHLYITSMKRNGDGSSWHDSGQAFDTADDNLESNKEARDWLVSEGEKLGLTPLDEYENPSAHATGGHIHFSDHGDPIPGGASLGDDSAESDVDVSTLDDDTTSTGADLSNLPLGNIATAISQNTGLPSNLIWAQLAHESANGTSQLAQEDHNYGGVKGEDGEYLHFDNDQQFIDYMSNYYPKYREDGIYDAKNADQWAEALQHGGYFTAGLDEYEGGMKRHLSEAGLSENAMQGGTVRRSHNSQDKNAGEPDLSGSFDISADDPGMDNMFASFAKDWQNMSTDANEINFFGDMFSSRGKFKATEENKQAILDNYGDAFRQYVQDNQPQTVQTTQTAQAPAQPKQAPQPQRIEMQTPNLDKAKTQQNVQQTTQGAQMPAAPQEAPRKTLQNVAAARLNNMLSEISGDSFKKLDHVQKLAYLMTARSYANTIGADQANNYIDSTVNKVRRAAGFTGNGVADGMNDTQKNAFYRSYTQQAYDAALDLRRNATDDTPTNLNDLDNTIQFLQQEVAKYKPIPTSAAKTTAKIPKRSTALASIPDSAIAAAKQADDGFSAPLNIFSSDEQAALRDAGLVYKDDSYNGAERVKVDPLFEEGDRRMNGGKVKAKAKTRATSKADKYKNDAEKIYLRFNSGKFSAEDSINQLNNLKKKATSDKALSDEEKAEVVAEADKHINRIKPQKETKEHETQKNSKIAETTQSSKAEGHPHQDAEPEESRTDAEESEVRTRKAADTQREAEKGEVSPAQQAKEEAGRKALERMHELYPHAVEGVRKAVEDFKSGKVTSAEEARNNINKASKELFNIMNDVPMFTKSFKEISRDGSVYHKFSDECRKAHREVNAIYEARKQSAEPKSDKAVNRAQNSDNKKAADEGGHTVRELAPGYKTESGKPLAEADEKEFILKPDGSKDFGEITDDISQAAKEQSGVDLAPGKIRLRVGNDKEGLLHAKKHEDQAKEDGYASIENMIADVAENFDAIYERPAKKTGDRPTYSLVKYGDKRKGKMNGTAPMYFDLENDGNGNYYLVITAIPTGDKSLARQTKKDRLIYSNPGLGVATTSNSSAVSRPRSKNVGATKGVRPTSDKSSGSSTHIIPHEQKEGTKNLDSAKVPAMGEPIRGRTGKETTVVTDSGKEIRVRYRLVPSYKVITSHDAETMTPNKAYPQELQPRDRQRVSMQEQVTAMANELRPADLGAGRNLNQGAPIIRKDGVVLNGNGRAMAIQKATAAGGEKATAYRKYIFEHSKEFGLSRPNLTQLRRYMLVREVLDDIDADTMQDIIGSTAGGSRMGASEQAKADAKKIKPRDLDSYVDNEQGDLTTAANQNFMANILYRIVGKNERNAYTDEHGNVNADGIQRVKRALFSLAYNDDGLIDKMAESTDDNIRNVSRGLMSAAPAFARVNLAVKDGQAYEYDAGKTISDAVKHLDALRREGKPVKDYLNEQSMFSEYQDTDEVREVLRFFDENKRSGEKIGIFLNDMARSILEQGSPNQTSLIDGGRATLGDIIKSAERVARDGTTAASLFDNAQEAPAEEKPEKTTNEKEDESIFGSVEDADKEMLDALGLSEDDLADDVLTAPSGIKNTAEEREKLEKELAAELNKLSANPVFNPKIYTLGLKLAMTYVKDGINTVKKLVAKLNAKFGDKIGPWAPALAETVRTWPKGVPFDEKKVMAISKAVGARYENGITSLDGMQADMKKLLKGQHDSFAPMIEASYNGIRKFFEAQKGESDHVDDSTSGLAERAGRGPDSDRVGPDDAGGESGRGSGRGVQETERAVQPEGGARVRDRSAAAGGETGNRGVQAEESGNRAGSAGSAHVSRSVRDSYEGSVGHDANRDAADVRPAQNRRDNANPAGARARAVKPNKSHKRGDLGSIKNDLPMLKPEQQEDVEFIEKRVNVNNKPGVMLTNGTGTGKTYSGLGFVKRMYDAGKKNILIVSPSESINNQWIGAAEKSFGIHIQKLDDTKDSGKDGEVCITTYANLQANRELVNRNWDAVISDESHTLMQNEKGEETGYLSMLRALTLNPRGAWKRFKLQHRTKEIRALESKVDAKEKEIKDILKPYKDKKKVSSADNAKVKALQKDIEDIEREMDGIFRKMAPSTDKLMQDLKAAYPEEKRPKVLFLSATPFAHDKDVDYAEGYLFNYEEDAGRYGGYNQGTPSDRFMMKHFGYRMRYNKLTRPDAEVDSRAMEVQFHDDLVNSGAMHGRQIDVDKDYDRGFILVDGGIGHKIDEGFKFLSDNHAAYGELQQVLLKQFNKSQQKYLIESIKAREVIPLIQEYVKKGKKVVLFHQSMVEHKNIHPFQLKPSADLAENSEVWAQWKAFKSARPDLVNLSLGNIPAPMETLRKELGGRAVFVNGKVSKDERARGIEQFNDDNSGMNIIVCQQDAANAGISLHDTTGKHPRVLINIAMPERPSYAMQIEGRIYRVGNASNAIFRYLSTGTDIEKNMFASTIGGRAASVENLAVGNAARGLRESFRDLYQETMDSSWRRRLPGAEGEGTGGKEMDYAVTADLSEYDRAKSFYFAHQKRTSRTKAQEGNDYFATPEPIGYKMVEWLGLKSGEKALEPSAGHGAISRWFPETTDRTIVEPSAQLMPLAQMNTPGAKAVQKPFEDFNIVNKFDGITMNPPFGVGGKTAVEHLQKAFKQLHDGGRVVAIIPEGPAADKRYNKMLDEIGSEVVPIADIHLPTVTFSRAGTNVGTHIVVLDRYTSKAEHQAATRNVLAHKDIDLRDINDINDLFNRLENMTMPERYDASNSRKAEPVPAPAVQLDEAKVEGAPDETPNFTVDEYERTDTHEIKFRARPKSYLGDQYRPIQKLAKAHGGHYSRFAKASFLFDDKDERDAFLQEAEEYLSDNKYSAEEAAEAQERALSDIKQEVASAFPNAKNVRDNGHEVLFSMPNGAELSVSIVPSIEVTESEENNARAAHGLAPEVHVKISGKERTIGSKALIELSQLGRKGTAYHEAFHAVYDMCLTDKEKAALHKAYDKEAKGRDVYEVMADKYRDWMIAKQKGQHTLYGKLWQKVKDAAARLARVVRGADNASDVFRKVASGDVWERPLNERNSDNRYLVTNEKVRPDTKVPIIDVTNEEKINVNSNKAAADIAKVLQGTAFRIIASDGVGEIETLKEGKHFVHGSNNLSRFDKTRRKALSVSEKILNNCVYVEKHPDVKHGTDHRYIELFAAVKDGEKMVRFRVVAREGEVGSGEFKIGQARFYDIIKDGKLPMYDTNGRNSIMGSSPSTLTIAELLKGVKDRNGRLYVNKDGSLNYDARIFRDGEEQANTRNSIEDSETRYSAEEEKEKKGAQSFLNTAASKLGKRMGVKSDKIIMEESNNSNGANKFDYLFSSPSRIAGRVAAFRQFYRMGARAMEVLTERRSYYQRKLGKAMQLVKSKNDYEELTDILLSGDAEGKEWTKEELIQSGTKENVAEAYTRIRRLMRQAYKMVNEAHKHPKTYSKRLSESKIEELRQNPFVKIMKVHDEEDDGRRLVTYREFANYEHTLEGVTKQALDGMRVDEDMQVLEATKQADGTYKVRVREGRGDVTNRKGYIPHFFHNYMVEVRDGDGNYVTTLTSGRTQREAVKKAEAWMKDNKLEDGQEIYIHPKIFDFTRLGMSEKGIVQLGDKDFYALMNRVAKDNDMSFKEAKDLLQGVHQKNRHRFFGNVLHRKGVSGFETDMNYVLNHYFNSASRYYAMETEFKPQAISLYERLFGDFAKDPNDALQQYTKDYINDVNGSPSAVEKWINKHLLNSKFWRYFVVSRFGERAALQAANSITSATTYMCLGYFNVSSALLNLTQVMNSAAYIGDVSALGKCLSKGMHRKYSLHDLKVLKETNVLNDIGLDSGSGYDMNRMSAKNLLGKINKAGMSIFKVSEQTVRIGTVLAAYESGIKRGMSHEEAIDFAKEVNRKSNFDYSIADAPNIFRRGSIFSQLALQFKKYGIKELEVMADMCSPRTSRKQKLIFWGTYLLAAGLCGLPALDWLDQLLAWVLGIKSPKLAAQAAIMEAAGGTPMGKFIGRMAMYGLPSALVGVDLSTRVGLSDVVPTDLKNFLPPLATKIPQFMHDIFSDAKINAVRDFSPAIYNQIAAWGTGESYGKRGRVNTEYNTFYDKLLRSIGFKSTDERIDSDIRRITSQRRSELTQKKQDAVDAYINNPTSENKKKLKDLGIKDSTVEKERQRKKEDSYNRTRSGMTKKEAAENKQLLDFK